MGNKKNIGNPYDDDFEKMTDVKGIMGDAAEGDMAQYDSYEKFDVTVKSEKLKKDCKKMIVSLCSIYLDTLQISNEDYVKAVAQIEEQNLFVLMKQVSYSEHVIDSLMRQLDSGGYVDKGIYSTIREMQKSAIQITLEISKYTRNLPEYFKFVARDAKAADSTTDILLNASQKNNNNIIDITETSEITSFNPMGPQRGLRDLMLAVSDVRQDIDNAIKNSKIIDATPMNPEDIDTFDERLEDDLDEDDE